jgi:cell division protein FtsX
VIRPATDQLKEEPIGTVGAVILLALAMALPGAVLSAAASVDRLAGRWMSDYRPVVYLEATADGAEAEQLAETIEGWGGVSTVEVRTPDEAFRQARRRVGEEPIAQVGIGPEMFPYSLVVESSDRWGGNIDLVARLAALDTRSSVEEVDVPEGVATRVAASAGWLAWAALVGLVVLLGVAMVQLSGFLQRLRHRDRRELALLERFGASPGRLRRSTWLRGALIGLWGGLAAFGIMLLLAVYWRSIERELLGGIGSAAATHWMIVAAPLIVGPVVGLLVGLGTARRPLDSSGTHELEIDELLDYG